MSPVTSQPIAPKGQVRSSQLLLTVPEACEQLRISRWMLYRLIQTRQLRTVKIGSSRRVPVAALGELVDQLREAEDC